MALKIWSINCILIWMAHEICTGSWRLLIFLLIILYTVSLIFRWRLSVLTSDFFHGIWAVLICPKYFNSLIVAKFSRESLSIICLVTDVFTIFISMVSSAFLYLLLFSPIQHHSKNFLQYLNCSVVWNFQDFYDFCHIFLCWFAQAYTFLGLFIGAAVISHENHKKI